MMVNNRLLGDKHELLSYGVSGVILAIINYGTFCILNLYFIDYMVANACSILIVRFVAYIMHKFYVYKSKTKGIVETLCEFFKFIFVRMFTGVLDFFVVMVLIEMVTLPADISKLIAMIFVIILNYFLGRWFVFRRRYSNKDSM